MTNPATTKLLKSQGLCIDCRRPAPLNKHRNKPAVRCTKCKDKLAATRLRAIRRGLCGQCRGAPKRAGKTTCRDCGLYGQTKHNEYLARLRKTCIQAEQMVESEQH
jgi:hypothetical protein